MNLQPVADIEHEDGSQGGENEAGGMESFIGWAGKEVSHGAAENRANDAEHNGPEEREMRVHDGPRETSGDEPNKNIPNKVEHSVFF
jgi:hypothetical protein